MHESIPASKTVKANASPSCEGVFADFVVLDFESGRDVSARGAWGLGFDGGKAVLVPA